MKIFMYIVIFLLVALIGWGIWFSLKSMVSYSKKSANQPDNITMTNREKKKKNNKGEESQEEKGIKLAQIDSLIFSIPKIIAGEETASGKVKLMQAVIDKNTIQINDLIIDGADANKIENGTTPYLLAIEQRYFAGVILMERAGGSLKPMMKADNQISFNDSCASDVLIYALLKNFRYKEETGFEDVLGRLLTANASNDQFMEKLLYVAAKSGIKFPGDFTELFKEKSYSVISLWNSISDYDISLIDKMNKDFKNRSYRKFTTGFKNEYLLKETRNMNLTNDSIIRNRIAIGKKLNKDDIGGVEDFRTGFRKDQILESLILKEQFQLIDELKQIRQYVPGESISAALKLAEWLHLDEGRSKLLKLQ